MVQENQEAESPRGCINTTNHDERESLERMETQLTVCENALLMLTYHICGDTRKGMDRYRREAITAPPVECARGPPPAREVVATPHSTIRVSLTSWRKS